MTRLPGFPVNCPIRLPAAFHFDSPASHSHYTQEGSAVERRKAPGRKIRAGAGRTGDAPRITGTGASTSYGDRTHAKEHAALRDLPRRGAGHAVHRAGDRKSTRLNSSN